MEVRTMSKDKPKANERQLEQRTIGYLNRAATEQDSWSTLIAVFTKSEAVSRIRSYP